MISQKANQGHSQVTISKKSSVVLTEFPNDWEFEAMGKEVNASGGYAFKSKDFVKNGIRVLKITNISNNNIEWKNVSYVPKNYWKEFSQYRLKNNDVVLALTGSIIRDGLKIGIFKDNEKTLLNQRVCKFETSSKLDKKFLYYFLSQNYFQNQIQFRTTKSSQPNISTEEIEKIILWYPKNIFEQQKIANILSNIDNLIDSNESAIKSTKKLKKSILQKIFSKGIGHKKFKKTVLGNIPIEWDLADLGKIGIWSGGGTPSNFVKEYWENGTIPWISAKDMKSFEKFDSKKKITLSGLENSSATLVKANSILFVVRSRILAKTLPIAIAKVNLSINQDMKALFPKNEYDVNFLFYCLLSKREHIRSSCFKHGIMGHSLDFQKLKSFTIPIPPKKEQIKIGSIISKIDQVLKHNEQNKRHVENIKEGLISKLLSGQIRVKV